MNTIVRRFLAFALSLVLIMSSFTTVYAQTPPPGGWKWDNAKVTVTREHNAFKASLQAQKTYPVAVVDPKTREILMKTKQQASTVKVAPTATRVGKSLMKRVPAVAMTQAIIALLGKSVDWVLDPENNGVKYKDPDGASFSNEYLWEIRHSSGNRYLSYKMSPDAVCASYLQLMTGLKPWFYDKVTVASIKDTQISCYFSSSTTSFSGTSIVYRVNNPNYDPNAAEADWQRIPINDIAQKVIEQANDGEAPATQVISDTALDMFEAGELDGALDAAAEPKVFNENEYHPNDPALKDFGNGETPSPNPDGGENPNPNPTPSELPAFCSWASIVCDWIGWTKEAHQETQDAIAANTEAQNQTNQKLDDLTVTDENGQKRLAVDFPTFCGWATPVCDFVDWVRLEPESQDTELDLEAPDTQPTDTTINFGGSCPAPFTYQGSIFGNPIEITLLDTAMFCDFLSTFVRFPVYAASSLFALYIVGGRKDG